MRRLIRVLLVGVIVAVFGQAKAQSPYPSRPVHIIVGFGAGSAADITARVVANRLSDTMGQRFIVENRPGGGSTVAAEQVVRGPKDGYTIYLGTVANVINAVLQPNLSFNFGKDFVPVALATSTPLVLVVHPSTGVSSVSKLIELAKSKPGQVFYGSSGVGTSPHLSGELFNMSAGTKMVHVPYQGSAQAVTDLLAGRTQVMFAPISTVLAHIRSGQLTALATTELKRSSELPDLPTVSEAGLTGFNTSVWLGFVAPAGTNGDVLNRLSDGINTALKEPGPSEALRKTGLEIVGGTPEQFGKFIESEYQKWNAVAATAGLQK
jgi:tripartite-type tricarboxylate transporter receptor subunit TctC